MVLLALTEFKSHFFRAISRLACLRLRIPGVLPSILWDGD